MRMIHTIYQILYELERGKAVIIPDYENFTNQELINEVWFYYHKYNKTTRLTFRRRNELFSRKEWS